MEHFCTTPTLLQVFLFLLPSFNPYKLDCVSGAMILIPLLIRVSHFPVILSHTMLKILVPWTNIQDKILGEKKKVLLLLINTVIMIKNEGAFGIALI